MRESRRLVFETHATSLDNEAGLASGHHDVALSPDGRRQAAELGGRYAHDRPSLVLTSDLQRAWMTAEIAFGGSVPIVRDRRLRECDYGTLSRRPARELDPLRLRAIHTPFPGGQSYGDCVQQVRGVLDELRRNWPGGWVLIVAHRATHYALDVLVHGHTLEDLVQAPFTWQAGWAYELIPDGATPSRQ
jgi:broad specificity phosphatase PhoE